VLAKPAFLDGSQALAFADAGTAAAYRHRPGYPPELFGRLAALMPAGNRTVLDLGCGTGFLARPLAEIARRVDAVDLSAEMIAAGRRLPGGDRPNLHWTVAAAERFASPHRYGLVTAGESLHWMDWEALLPRLRDRLEPDGWLAVVDLRPADEPWSDAVRAAVVRHSVNAAERRRYDTARELAARGLFREHGRAATAPVRRVQSVDDYAESFHARSSLARSRLSAATALAFGQEVRDVFRRAGLAVVRQDWTAELVWGRPA